MDLMSIIKGRRSVRKFTEQEVSAEQVEFLLEAVRWAPSWRNNQCWQIVIVKDAQIKQQISALMPGNPAAGAVTAAPLLFVMCARKGKSGYKSGQIVTEKGDTWYMFDMGIAGEHLCLAAYEQGLGSVHVGGFDATEVSNLLHLPEDVIPIEVIPVGYQGEDTKGPRRKEIEEFVFVDQYGQPYVR